MNRFSIVHFLLVSGFCTAAAAAPQYIWSDSQGLVAQKNCQTGIKSILPLHIATKSFEDSKSAVAFRNSSDSQLRSTPARTLIRFLDTSVKNQQRHVRILYIPQNASIKTSSNLTSKNMDGYIADRDLQPIDDYVFEVTSATEKMLAHTFWQVILEGNNYSAVSCETNSSKKTYVLFNVFDTKNRMPIAQVGLNIDNLSILKSSNIHTSIEGEKILTESQRKFIEDSEKNSSVAKPVVTSPTGDRPATPPTSTATNPTSIPPLQKPTTKVPDKVQTKPVTDNIVIEDKVDDLTDEDEQKPGNDNSGAVFDYMICIEDGQLNIRDKKITNVLFKANPFERVRQVQSFDSSLNPGYMQIQFPHRGNKVGWAAKSYVKLKSDCKPYLANLKNETSSDEANAVARRTSGSIYSETCCVFPTSKRPTQSYKEGMRRYGWRRGGTRIHAGVDLYRHKGDPAKAITNGVVIRGLYPFYMGVYALEILHSGGQVARYGEILGYAMPGIGKDKSVVPGQVIGKIGKINTRSGCCNPMLHFELYSGSKKGSLSGGGRFQRRSDLMNPTDYLSRWEKKTFGQSY